jgi:DNA-binding response OmpR family regulator
MTAALLLAEPEPAIRGYLERQLANDGFHVLKAAFGSEALALAERSRPDIVLCAELELCARLRAGEPGRTWNRNVPVIVLGPEEADAVDRVRAFHRGADDYVPRPVVYDELLALVSGSIRIAISGCLWRFAALFSFARRFREHFRPGVRRPDARYKRYGPAARRRRLRARSLEPERVASLVSLCRPPGG